MELPKALPGHVGGRPPGRCTEEKGREEGEEVEGSEQRQEKNETIEEVIKSLSENGLGRMLYKRKKKD